jgi:hypothetical protein
MKQIGQPLSTSIVQHILKGIMIKSSRFEILWDDLGVLKILWDNLGGCTFTQE